MSLGGAGSRGASAGVCVHEINAIDNESCEMSSSNTPRTYKQTSQPHEEPTNRRAIVGTYRAGTFDNNGRPPKPNWAVFITSGIGVILVSIWGLVNKDSAESTLNTVTGWITSNFGWFLILTVAAALIFMLFIACSRAGSIKLGPDHARPQYSLFSWSAMLFAAGIGIGLMFYSVAEPINQYYGPPEGEGETAAAARDAVVWTFFHYGMSGWALYALLGMAFGYYAYRLNMPLAIRSALYPILGKRVHGPVGDAVDIAAMLGTVFGVAASLGIGVVQLNFGLQFLFGIPEGHAAQIGLVVVAILAATVSAVAGVDKGIKRISEINVYLALLLMVYVLVTGKTAFLFDAMMQNIGDYLTKLPSWTFSSFAYSTTPAQTGEWMQTWTLFFWAWWVAWAPFVGLFLARISRGRTLRQFIVGTLVVPFTFTALWASIFGNTALDRVMGGDTEFGLLTNDNPQQGFFVLLDALPYGSVMVALSLLVGMLFFVTSADSGALVMSNFASHVTDSQQDGAKWQRVFWVAVVGLLTVTMLQINGISALQSATIVMGIPFAIVVYLLMFGLSKSLRLEVFEQQSRKVALHSAISSRTGRNSEEDWRSRIQRASTWPDQQRSQEYVETIARPALEDVATQMREQGIDALLTTSEVEGTGINQLDLLVDFGTEEKSFRYQIYPVRELSPGFAHTTETVYYRLEVFSQSGSLGYDVYGYTRQQLISNLLDLYDRHLEFLHMQQYLPGGSDHSDNASFVDQWPAEDQH